MTKLMEWLLGLSIYLSIYIAIITKQVKLPLIDQFFFEFQISPIVLIVLFGVR